MQHFIVQKLMLKHPDPCSHDTTAVWFHCNGASIVPWHSLLFVAVVYDTRDNRYRLIFFLFNKRDERFFAWEFSEKVQLFISVELHTMSCSVGDVCTI